MLKAGYFANDPRLAQCAISHAAHIQKGAKGPYVRKIQAALQILDKANIDAGELNSETYGTSTAKAVLSYKTKRKIINQSYQAQADDIVGIMTIAALDAELFSKQVEVKPVIGGRCGRNCKCLPDRGGYAAVQVLRNTAISRLA